MSISKKLAIYWMGIVSGAVLSGLVFSHAWAALGVLATGLLIFGTAFAITTFLGSD